MNGMGWSTRRIATLAIASCLVAACTPRRSEPSVATAPTTLPRAEPTSCSLARADWNCVFTTRSESGQQLLYGEPLAGVHALVNQTWAADETCELSIRFDETRIAMTMKSDRLVETAEGVEPSVAIEPPWGGSAAAQCSCVTHLGAIYSRSSGE